MDVRPVTEFTAFSIQWFNDKAPELRLHLHSLVVPEAEVVVSADAEVGNAMQANKMKRPLSMIKKLFFIDFLLLLYISHNFLDFILL